MPADNANAAARGRRYAAPRAHRGRALAVVALVLAAGCEPPPTSAPAIRPVRVEHVEPRGTEFVATYSGEVRARVEVPLAFRVPGKINERLVDVGATVAAGQPLARLDPEDLNLSIQNLEAQRAAAQADLDFARAEHARFEALIERKLVSANAYQQSQNQLNTARARFAQVQAQYEQSRNQSRYATLAADRDGVITAVEAEAGQVVAAGQTVLRLAVPEEKEVTIAVPENHLADLQGVGTIRVSLWAEPGAVYRGRLREISPDADAMTRTYAARVTLLDADARVQLGMTANVTLARERHTPHLTVPTTALLHAEGRAAVWVVDPQTLRVKQVPVTIGTFDHNRVIVTTGITAGMTVVTAGVNRLHEGQKVRLAGGG